VKQKCCARCEGRGGCFGAERGDALKVTPWLEGGTQELHIKRNITARICNMTDKQLALVLMLWFAGSVLYYEWNSIASDYASLSLSSGASSEDPSASAPTTVEGLGLFVFTMSTAQLSVGVVFTFLMWLLHLRPLPQIGGWCGADAAPAHCSAMCAASHSFDVLSLD